MWFLAPPSAWTRLPCVVPGLVDVAGDRRRADEADGRDVRVLEDRVDRDLVAVDDVEHAVGDARLVEQLGEEDRRRGVLLGRLEDERVAARDGGREHPHRHHRREVERGDAGDHAERLADLVDVDAGAGLLAEAALEQVRDAARELEVLEAAGDLAQGVGRDLAVLCREVRGQLVARCSTRLRILNRMSVRLLSDVARQAGKAALGRRDGGRDLLGRGEVDVLGQRPGGRVVDTALAARRPGDDAGRRSSG